MTLLNLIHQLKGGPGSGNHGHQGRPGKRGGSVGGPNIIAAEFEGGPTILRDPVSKQQIISFLAKAKPTWYKAAFYVNPKTNEMYVSSQQDHLPLAKQVAKHQNVYGNANINQRATDIDDSHVHGYMIKDMGKVTLVFRMNGVGIAKSEYEYSDKDKNLASKRIYNQIDRLGKIGFQGTDYVISSLDGSIIGSV